MYDFCRYIEDELSFNTYKEFSLLKRKIIEQYKIMEKHQIRIYRMYVYERPFMSEKMKDKIWNEINGYEYLNYLDELMEDIQSKF